MRTMSIGYAVANTVVLFAVLLSAGLTLQYTLTGIIKLAGLMSHPKLVNLFVNLLTFPGVAHHEIAHAFMASVSGARVTEIKLYEFSKDRLGHVSYVPTGSPVKQSVQHCLTSMGPVLLGPVTVWLLWSVYHMAGLSSVSWARGLLAYLSVSIIVHMRLSKADIKNARKGLPLCMLAVCVMVFLLRIDVIGAIRALVP